MIQLIFSEVFKGFRGGGQGISQMRILALETIDKWRKAATGNTHRRIWHRIVDGIEYRWCCGCREFKPIAQFYKNKSKWDCLSIECKDCTNVSYKKRSICNPEKVRGFKKNWAAKNREKRNATALRSFRKRMLDPKFRLRLAVSNAISDVLAGRKKRRSWEKLVGYSLSDLCKHLEKKFQKEMTWSNYGKWHIDHIIPVSAFSFDNPEQIDFKRCFALENLRPLWAKENLAKGSKLAKPFQPALKIAG